MHKVANNNKVLIAEKNDGFNNYRRIYNDIIEEIKNLEIGNLTPMEALNILYNLQNKIKNRW